MDRKRAAGLCDTRSDGQAGLPDGYGLGSSVFPRLNGGDEARWLSKSHVRRLRQVALVRNNHEHANRGLSDVCSIEPGKLV